MASSDTFQPANPVICGDYLVKPGACISSIAAATGHIWKTIWDHPANADLKATRDPHVLLPGDRVFIPPIAYRSEPADTDMTHTFVCKLVPATLRLVVKDLDELLVSQPYILTIDGISIRGVTDGKGRIEEPISPEAQNGHLRVGEGDDALECEFQLGTLDPVESVTGIQARLTNLGYQPGPVDGISGPKTTAAIEDFCADHEIDPPAEGEISQELCDTLAQAHGF